MAADITVRQGAAGNPIEAETAVHIDVTGTDPYMANPAAVAILTSSIADPTVITTDGAHGLTTGDIVSIIGHTSVTPSIDGDWEVTVIDTDEFSIPIEVTADGAGGEVVLRYYADGRKVGEEIRYVLVVDAPAGVDDATSVVFAVNADGEWTWDGYIFPADGSYTIRLKDITAMGSDVATQAVTVAAAS